MMRTRRGWMGALVGAAILWTAPALAQVTITIEDATPDGNMAVVNVSLAANGGNVGGMQNDIIFDNTKVQLSAATQCRINTAIGLTPPGGDCMDDTSVGPCKNLSRVLNVCGGTPQAQGCPVGAGSNISVFRGIIAATAAPNNNAIPDGVLYSCTFSVVGDLPADLMNSNIVVSDPFGARIDSNGVDGTIGGNGGPTPTPTTPPIDGVGIRINDADVVGGMANVDVSLESNGENVGGMQNDIIFDNTKVQLSAATQCRINPAIGLTPPGGDCMDDTSVGPCKNLSRVLNVCGGTPQAQGCPAGAGTNISVFRGIIAATAAPNNNAIPDGVLYTCTFTVVEPTCLTNSNVVVSDPFGARLDAGGINGCIGAAPATPTPTNTVDVPPTATNTVVVVPTATPVTPTNTVPPATATATATAEGPEECTATVAQPSAAGAVTLVLAGNADCFPEGGGTVQVGSAFQIGYTERVGNTLFLSSPLPSAVTAGTVITLLGGAGDDDDGCHINARAANSNAWVLLIPALGLLALRGRRW